MTGWRRLFLLILVFAVPHEAVSQMSREQILARVYPGAEIRAERIFLTDVQQRDAREIAGVDIPSSLIARYVAVRDGNVAGRAYVDTHVVRTKRESLLICLDQDGNVRRIEVTAFLEPPEYQAPRAWYDQYNGKSLNEDLRLHRTIRPIAGASLTAKATADAARRVIAIDRILGMKEGKK
jgi:Na+-translocating ferredoxin:NAD+ oxidoreductase subunit G